MKGKLIAGLLGFMLGGPLGALLGVIIGHWFDKSLRIIQAPNPADQQAIIEKCFELMGALCKADGHVSEAEIRTAESILQRLRVSGDARQSAIRAFNRGKQTGFDVGQATAELRSLCRGRILWLRLSLEILLSGAAADGKLDEAERKLLLEIAAGLGIPTAELEQMLALLSGGFGAAGASAPGAPRRDSLAEAYKVLGINRDASDAEAKKAYRRLMSRHHPDKLAARELPPAMREQAEEQVRRIRAAWDTVAAARGL